MAYAARTDIELIFGKANVKRWADVDNVGSEATIELRVDWALELATEQIENRIRFAAYELPIEELPLELVDCCARLAGVLLYESRGFEDSEDSDGTHKLIGHRKQAMRFIGSVSSGRVVLAGTRITSGGPSVVELE